MIKVDDLEYIEIEDSKKTKQKNKKAIDIEKVKKILSEIRDTVTDYVPEPHL